MMPLPSAVEVGDSKGGRASKRFVPLKRGRGDDGSGEGVGQEAEGGKRTLLQGIVFDVDGTLW